MKDQVLRCSNSKGHSAAHYDTPQAEEHIAHESMLVAYTPLPIAYGLMLGAYSTRPMAHDRGHMAHGLMLVAQMYGLTIGLWAGRKVYRRPFG